VEVRTPDPLKVDMTVRLDIYQQEAPKSKGEELSIEVAASRRQRLGAILQLKADHVVGENRDGYLEMREPPKDPVQKANAEKLVEAENSDRSVIYLNNAQTESKPLEEVEENYSKIWTDRALPGEWIQLSTGQWKSK
jgi:uncharacterized protein YdbL (DUF1318 family)